MAYVKRVIDHVCPMCGLSFQGRPDAKYCSNECRKIARGRRFEPEVITELTTGTRGAIAELKACAVLMERGWHLFRAQSPSCPCDLVAMRDGLSVLIEVRSAVRSKVTGTVSFPTRSTDLCHAYMLIFRNGPIEVREGTLPLNPETFSKLM